MTTLDATKLSRIKTQVGVFPALTKERLMLLAQAIWDAAQAEQREEDAKLCKENCAGYEYSRDRQGPCLTEFPKECGGRHDGMTYAAAIRGQTK